MKRNVKRLGSALGRTDKPIEDGRPRAADAAAGDGALSDFVEGLRTSSLRNERTGIGTVRDQRVGTTYVPTQPINRVLVESIFRGSWLGNRIVCTLPEDMVRNWRRVKWEGMKDADENVKTLQRVEKKLQVKKRLVTGSKWARGYGGALLIPVLRSQPDEVLDQPLDVEDVQKDDLVAIHVFDRWRASHDGSIVMDAMDPACGMPEHYRLAESSVRLHHTRVIRLEGKEMPYFIWRANSMWHDSVLQILVNNIKQYDTAVAAITTMLFQCNVDIVMMEGLRKLLAEKNGAQKALERWQQFAMGKSFNGVAVLDKGTEEFQRHPYTFSGVDKAFDKVMHDVCGAADVPFTRLFGQSPAGMNATGESDARNYYDHVAARREDHLDPALNQLDQFVVRSALGFMPDGYESEWLPLWQMSEGEKEQAELTRAQRRQTDIDSGVIDEGVAAQDVYDRGLYSSMTQAHVRAAQDVAKSSAQLRDRALAAGVDPASLTKFGGKKPEPGTKKPEEKQGLTPEDDGDEEEKE